MIDIKAETTTGTKKLKVPVLLQDITLEQVQRFHLEVEKHKPIKLKKIEQTKNKRRKNELIKKLTEREYHIVFLPYFCRYIANYMNIPINIALQLPKSIVEKCYNNINRILREVPQYKYSDEPIEVSGQKFYFPARFMEDSSTISFIEALQVQHEANISKENFVLALNGVAAAILRKSKTEIFKDEVFEERKQLFKGLNMKDAYRVAFFLSRQNKRLSDRLNLSLSILINTRISEKPPELMK